MIEALILIVGMCTGWWIKPETAIIPPQAVALTRCTPLTRPADGTLAEVYRSAVEAGTKYRQTCINHDELVDWAGRVTKGNE